MIDVTYNYEILSVDEINKIMEVKYSAEGHATHIVGAMFPLADQDIEEVIHSYAPLGLWYEASVERVAVAVGTKGTVTHVQNPPEPEVLEVPEVLEDLNQVSV